MTLHLKEGLYLRQRQILPVAQGHNLIECAEELKGIAKYFPLIQTLANACNDLGEEMQAVNVLEDVGLSVCDEHDVEFVQRLIDEADVVLLDGGVLGAGIRKFREGG
jgi:hypothetical protein